MFTGQKDQSAGRHSRSQDVRERHLYPRLRNRLFGRGRSWCQQQPQRLQAPQERSASNAIKREQLFHPEDAEHASGLPEWRKSERSRRFRPRANTALDFSFLLCVTIACGLACDRRESPQAAYQHAYKTFVHGDLKQSQDEAHRECARFRDSNPELAWKFRIVEAESSLWQGMYQQVLTTLNSQPSQPRNNDSLIEVLAIEGAALGRLHQFPEAEQRLGQALHICQDSPQDTCGDVTRARGVVAMQQGQLDAAKLFFEQSLQFADSHHDSLLRETALLNLGLTSLRELHFDESIDWTDAAYRESTISGADVVTQSALGNLGWAYYLLGDTEKSLELSLEAAKRASHAGNVTGQLTWVTAAGYVYASRGDIAGATQSYLEALDLAKKTGGQEAIYAAYRALALVSVESGKLDEAGR